jgi:transposase InsO family protein
MVANSDVINDLINNVYSRQEFNLYGYQLSTEELRDMGYKINHKKLYRLMKEHGLLLNRTSTKRKDRCWVKWRTISDVAPVEYICMDIKYLYIHGERRYGFLLVIQDVGTRSVLNWSLKCTMKYTDVILALEKIFNHSKIKKLSIRTDNGSQFIAAGLKRYLENKPVTHEFTHVATPEENPYVESLFSNIQREVIDRFYFSSIHHAKDVFFRYFYWYNFQKRQHRLKRKCPVDFWNTHFPSHPVRPREIVSSDFVKGLDTNDIIKDQSSLALPLTKSEAGLNLPGQDEKNVLN